MTSIDSDIELVVDIVVWKPLRLTTIAYNLILFYITYKCGVRFEFFLKIYIYIKIRHVGSLGYEVDISKCVSLMSKKILGLKVEIT